MSDILWSVRRRSGVYVSYYNRGLPRYSLGDYQGAISDLQQAAKLFQQQGNNIGYQQTLQTLKTTFNVSPENDSKTIPSNRISQTRPIAQWSWKDGVVLTIHKIQQCAQMSSFICAVYSVNKSPQQKIKVYYQYRLPNGIWRSDVVFTEDILNPGRFYEMDIFMPDNYGGNLEWNGAER